MIWFAGDTHGSFRHVVEHVLEAKRDDRLPQAIVFLGDLDCARPLHVELDEIAGLTEIFWIPGNHDSDDNTAWNNLFASEPSEANLHCRVADVAGLRASQASAVFSGRSIWSPPDPPAFQTYDAWREDLHAVVHRRTGGLLRRLRSAVTRRRFSLTWLRAWAPSVRIFWCRMKRLSAALTGAVGKLWATSLAASG